MSEQDIADVAASFQAAVVEVLVAKTMRAVRKSGAGRVVVGGGVAANKALREGLQQACDAEGVALNLTPMRYCTDNAAMIAYLGGKMLDAGQTTPLSLEPRAGYA
jgi:N6-L-threonylcarbamoyladenine synthase